MIGLWTRPRQILPAFIGFLCLLSVASAAPIEVLDTEVLAPVAPQNIVVESAEERDNLNAIKSHVIEHHLIDEELADKIKNIDDQNINIYGENDGDEYLIIRLPGQHRPTEAIVPTVNLDDVIIVDATTEVAATEVAATEVAVTEVAATEILPTSDLETADAATEAVDPVAPVEPTDSSENAESADNNSEGETSVDPSGAPAEATTVDDSVVIPDLVDVTEAPEDDTVPEAGPSETPEVVDTTDTDLNVKPEGEDTEEYIYNTDKPTEEDGDSGASVPATEAPETDTEVAVVDPGETDVTGSVAPTEAPATPTPAETVPVTDPATVATEINNAGVLPQTDDKEKTTEEDDTFTIFGFTWWKFLLVFWILFL